MPDRPVITALRSVPEPVKGLVRDLRVRWALEEVGQAYDVRRLDRAALKGDAYRRDQPFGQVPTYRHGDVALFESGAIMLRIAPDWPGLLPDHAAGAAKAEQWMFAALTTVEPAVHELALVDVIERDQPWQAARRPLVIARLHERLDELAAALGDDAWLEDRFTVGDLAMACVLRRLVRSRTLDSYPALHAYLDRAEARPAFQRALTAHLADFDPAPAAAG